MHSPEQVKEVIDLYRKGWGQLSITRMTGVSEAVVVRILRGQHRHNQVRLMRGKRPGKELRIYQK